MYNDIIIKLYSKAEVFKKTLTGAKLATPVSFSEILDYGYGGFTFRYADGFDSDEFEHGDIVYIIKNGTQTLYKGHVYVIKRVINATGNYVEVSTQGMLSLLNFALFDDTGNYEFSSNKDAGEMIEDIFTVANTELGTNFNRDGSSLPAYGTTLDLEFDHDSCFSALKKVLDNTNYSLRIDGDDKVWFFDASATTVHVLTFKNHINELIVEEKSDKLINDYLLEYNATSDTDNDATSITAYGQRTAYVNKSDVADATTAAEYLASLLLETKNPALNTRITVNRNYDLEDLKVGDQVTIKNLGTVYGVTEKIIEKLDYKGDYVVLYIDSYDSIAKSLSEL